jgi:hypothetical protein
LAGRLAGVEALAGFSPTAGGPLAFALKNAICYQQDENSYGMEPEKG